MHKYTFTFGTNITYVMFEKDKKHAINRFLEEVGVGVPFHVEGPDK